MQLDWAAQLNWAAYNFAPHDGYGRYAMHMVRALSRLGVAVRPVLLGQLALPGWLQRLGGVDLSRLTVTCTPPYMLRGLPGRQWALSMTEGTRLPVGWADKLNETCERVIVPCEHNRRAFVDSGVEVPVHVVPGGTSPEEFPVLECGPRRPYTFLALADRGSRKGWIEVWEAFYRTFGSPQDTPDVRLLIKTRPHANSLIDRIAGACTDPRVSFWREDVGMPADLYAAADCVAIPSHSEGWGMPHREAAMMGLPVIATRYSGLEDGIDHWAAVVIEKYRIEPVPEIYAQYVAGDWARPDVDELAAALRWCYEHPDEAARRGQRAAWWLRRNQTWERSAQALLQLIEEHA